MPITLEDIQKDFESNPFLSHIGFQIIYFEEGNVKVKLTIEEYLMNTNGTLHGGVYATMLDFILGMVLRSVTKTRCVTTNLTIHYLASMSEGELYAEAKVLQQGYKLAFAEGEIKDMKGNVITKGIGTFKLIREE
ncbi:PaaI family thioesterase [Peribacillus frigoritolerans]|uniref:PaaI family thioesterase n=1 Tax=Peribacillus frigoritolerans TaxID=450367 RepID=UPI002079ABA4|nr:PaaI family thioesterase [Peribacillus frigoritolerans]USK67507.1 PaaI family thioesterase [Peribacillus frigoritolerans]